MKIVLSCAADAPAARRPSGDAQPQAIASCHGCLLAPPWSSVRERPQPELLLGDLPEPREPVRLDDQEEDDEPAEDHQLDLLQQRHRRPAPSSAAGW